MKKLVTLIAILSSGCGEAFEPNFFPTEVGDAAGGTGGTSGSAGAAGSAGALPEEDAGAEDADAGDAPSEPEPEDAAAEEASPPGPCDTCAHTEWFCAGYVCGTGNCYICQDPACAPKGCTYLGQAEVNYPTWCCPEEAP